MPETEAERKKREEEEKKKKPAPGEQATALETAPKEKVVAAPTAATAAGRAAASRGHTTEEAKRARTEQAVESALVKEQVQTVGGPRDPAVVGLEYAKGKGYQPGIGGAGAFNAAFKTIYAGGQAGLSPEQAADLTMKKLRGGK